MDDIKKVPTWAIIAVIVIFLVVIAIIIALWFLKEQLAAILVAVMLASITTGVVVSWCAASLLREGARIALFAQKSDDDRDIQLLRTVTDMGKIWRQVQGDLPALPMPDQQSGWLCEYEDGDYTEMN